MFQGLVEALCPSVPKSPESSRDLEKGAEEGFYIKKCCYREIKVGQQGDGFACGRELTIAAGDRKN